MKTTVNKCLELLANNPFYTSYLNEAIVEVLETGFANNFEVEIPISLKPLMNMSYLKVSNYAHREMIDKIVCEVLLAVIAFNDVEMEDTFIELVSETLEEYGLQDYIETELLKASDLTNYLQECKETYANSLPILIIGNLVYCINLEGAGL